jgi:hypothetical protein
MARRLKFIVVSNPSEHGSSESRESIQSHIMRQVHADKRRLRMQEHQRETRQDLALQDLDLLRSYVSGPLSSITAGLTDPFSATARPLSSGEYFLLHHCTCLDKWNHLIRPGSEIESALMQEKLKRQFSESNALADIQFVVPAQIGHCALFEHPGDHKATIMREWVSLAITDDALMAAAVFLSTCRWILLQRPGHAVVTRLALQYKSTCLRSLRLDVGGRASVVKQSTVAKAIALAIDEVRHS